MTFESERAQVVKRLAALRKIIEVADVHKAILSLSGGAEKEWERDINKALRMLLFMRGIGQWEGEADGYADGELVYDSWNCGVCGYYVETEGEEPDFYFCPYCGYMLKTPPDFKGKLKENSRKILGDGFAEIEAIDPADESCISRLFNENDCGEENK